MCVCGGGGGGGGGVAAEVSLKCSDASSGGKAVDVYFECIYVQSVVR